MQVRIGQRTDLDGVDRLGAVAVERTLPSTGVECLGVHREIIGREPRRERVGVDQSVEQAIVGALLAEQRTIGAAACCVVDHPQCTRRVGADLGLGHSGHLGDVGLVEERVGVRLLPHLERVVLADRCVRHAQPGDGADLVGVEPGGVVGDRRTPVVSEHDGAAVAERVDHRGGVSGDLGHRVPLDLGRLRAAAVAADVHGGNGEVTFGEMDHLVAPRVPELGPTVDAQDERPGAERGDADLDVAVVDGHECRIDHGLPPWPQLAASVHRTVVGGLHYVGVVELSERSLGWLRYLHRKAHTADDWSRTGRPHPHWDDRSDPPMASWHRFDLVDSSYAMGLMAHRTPAWTEPYVAILDELIERHTGWWSASDWLTQFGHDPDRASYPDLYRLFIPPELFGVYDAPGWTANGIEPWGVQNDPVAADGMLFYKGFFLVLLGIRSMIAGDDRWNEPFEMIRDGADTFAWTHTEIAEHLCRQWLAAPLGCH